MSKKLLGIGLVVLVIAILGVTSVFAQDVDNAQPPVVGPNFQDADGDGVCDVCGQVPGEGFGQGMMGGQFGQGMMGGQNGMMGSTSLTAIAADMAGMTIQEAVAELAQGLSIADFAANHGLDVQAVTDAYLTARADWLATAVADGYMTQEQADYMIANMDSLIADHINQPWVQGGYGQHGTNPDCPIYDGETGTFGPQGQGSRGGNGMRGGFGGGQGRVAQGTGA